MRLDQYALCFMLLFAVNELKEEIDTPIIKLAIELVEWEHKTRQQFDPIDVDNESAKIEERIKRKLKLEPQARRKLQQNTSAHRSGLYLWNNALENLLTDKQVFYDQKHKVYILVSE